MSDESETFRSGVTAREFRRSLRRLIGSPVVGHEWDARIELAREVLRELETIDEPAPESTAMRPEIAIVPPEPGRRAIDEALYPGQGCSERVGFVSTSATRASETPEDSLWVLFRARALYAFVPPINRPFEMLASATFLPRPAGEGAPCPVPGLTRVPIAPRAISSDAYPALRGRDASWSDFAQTTYALDISPTRALLPSAESGWAWEDVSAELRARTPDGRDPFTFAHQFQQTVRLELELCAEGETLAHESLDVEIFDTSRMGSLYQRTIDRLLPRDLAAQGARVAGADLHVGHHPWFAILSLTLDKTRRHLRAIHQDLEQNRKNFHDPAWLLRVEVYHELLTCLGLFEAVRADHPDLLSAEEREVFERARLYEPLRRRLSVEAWRKAWATREIAPRVAGVPAAGPVSLTNLARKQRASTAFLEAHHEDLKHAIELAGPNAEDAQETWQRIFRDAERALLRNSLVAFPELGALAQWQRDFALWHQAGDVKLFRMPIPAALTSALGDQDGIYPAICRKYRTSMNEVARWASARKLMGHTGSECIPASASLFEAYVSKNTPLLHSLQRRDGYGPTLELDEELPGTEVHSPEEVAGLVRRIPVFRPLTDREIDRIAAQARRVVHGPLDRIVVQGHKGSSLFLVAAGSVEVLTRQGDGTEIPVATLDEGAVFGEFALLTGDERAATVRATDDEVVLFEVSREALQPVLEARPQLVAELSRLMAARQSATATASAQFAEQRADSLAGRIRRIFFR